MVFLLVVPCPTWSMGLLDPLVKAHISCSCNIKEVFVPCLRGGLFVCCSTCQQAGKEDTSADAAWVMQFVLHFEPLYRTSNGSSY